MQFYQIWLDGNIGKQPQLWLKLSLTVIGVQKRCGIIFPTSEQQQYTDTGNVPFQDMMYLAFVKFLYDSIVCYFHVSNYDCVWRT